MAAQQVSTPKATENGALVASERQELERLRASRRQRQMEQSILMGAFGFGVMFAGFGPFGAAGGMLFGGLAGYFIERHAEATRARSGT